MKKEIKGDLISTIDLNHRSILTVGLNLYMDQDQIFGQKLPPLSAATPLVSVSDGGLWLITAART